jgi:YggT family protein
MKSSAGAGAFMRAILDVLLLVLQIYTYIIIIVAIMSWLIAFNVINVYNNVVRSIWNALNAVTEPLLKPIRSILPAFGGLDISPVILLLLIFLIQDIIERYIYPNVF